MTPTRRRLLAGFGTGLVGTVAGCTGSGGRESRDPDRGPFSANTVSTARAVADEAQEAVVKIIDKARDTKGTGFHIGDGYFLTNEHNLNDDRRRIEVHTHPSARRFDTRKFDATVLGATKFGVVDLALIQAPVANLPAVSYADSTDLSDEQPLVSVGHPAGVGNWITMLGSFHEYITDTTNTYEVVEAPRMIRSYGPVRQGASGSPIMTLDGTVVGCLFQSSPDFPAEVPTEVKTDLEAYRENELVGHVDASVFDDYISQWR